MQPIGDEMDVHTFFGLTYANYLVLHRTLLQSMPDEWQLRFIDCVRELQDAFSHLDQANNYMVQARTLDGKFMKDPIPHYNRGRTFVEPNTVI